MERSYTMNKILRLGYIFSSVIFAFTVSAQVFAEDSTSNKIQAIDVSTVRGGFMLVKVTFDRPFDTVPTGVSLNNPARIYFDFVNISRVC